MSISFNVIGIIDNEMCIFVRDSIYNCIDTDYPLWKCDVVFDEQEDIVLEYQYMYCDESYKESFTRYLNVTPGMEYSTDHEFFKREETEEVTFLPEIWERPYEPSSSKMFNINYVGTLYLETNNAFSALKEMHKLPHSDIKVPFIGKYYG